MGLCANRHCRQCAYELRGIILACRLSQNELSGRTGVDEHKLAGFFLIYRDLQALTTDVSEA